LEREEARKPAKENTGEDEWPLLRDHQEAPHTNGRKRKTGGVGKGPL